MSVLDRILERKRTEVAAAKRRVPLRALHAQARNLGPTRGFRAALVGGDPPRVIAEIKRRSPSRGEIRADFDPVDCARRYRKGGAAALSVLTDEADFGGHLDHLRAVRDAVPLPLLRKDFVVDAYQVDEARAAGADAVLLIAAALDLEALRGLRAHALALDLDALVEVHDERELEVARAAGADLVGINNRDLKSFRVDLATTERLAPKLRGEAVVVAESGIFTPQDVERLAGAGANAFLVGESLMRQADPGVALEQLRGKA